jgi:hypothetical protein
MENDDFLGDELRTQLVFFFNLKEGLKDLDDRIRTTSLYLARKDLESKHRDVQDWEIVSRPDESTVTGLINDDPIVTAKVRTMSLHGKSTFGGRQNEAMKRNLEKLSEDIATYKYLYLLDPWTVSIVEDTFSPADVTVLSLLREDIAQVVRASADSVDTGMPGMMEHSAQMVEEIITKEDYPEERTIVSPISRTSIRQGFLYIPKEKGELLAEGPITIWIRKDASLESKCMMSQTGGVRIGGGLTKWFRSVGLQPDDELVMGSKEDGSLLILMIRRNQPFRPSSPMIETVKWD